MTEIVRQAAATLYGHPLRSSLGALAIAVAVATIVMVVTALDGVRRYAEATTARTFGSDTFVIAQVASPGACHAGSCRRSSSATRPSGAPISHSWIAIEAGWRSTPRPPKRAPKYRRGPLVVEDALVTGATSTIA